MHIYARQGDLVIRKTAISINDLAKVTSLQLVGRDSASHMVEGTVLYLRRDRITLVRVTEPTRIVHAGRHKAVMLEPGDYEITPLRERGDQSDRAVED